MTRSLPRFPLYIPTYKRSDSRYTIKALQSMGVPFRAVIEAEEYEDYAAVVPRENLLIFDPDYWRTYETLDDLGDSKSKGAGPKRNFIWDHSISEGHKWHWVMDDNIRCFRRYNRNEKVKCTHPSFWRAMEDFCLRYKNVGMAGPNYYMFQPARQKSPPLIFNTRIYSCNLIRNDIPYRWRGRYNEDTILSLDILEGGWVTLLFNGFLQEKITTQKVSGGNTESFYSKEGTLPKSKMLKEVYPDITEITWKYGRWHHHVDYRKYRSNILLRKDDPELPEDPEYGMRLTSKEAAESRHKGSGR